MLLKSDEAVAELLRLCQHCWEEKNIPDGWRVATIVLLFKKGDTSIPSNYRPIALLPVGYKILAKMLQTRLQEGGAEGRVRPTQYGIRPGRSTAQAIDVVSMRNKTNRLEELFFDLVAKNLKEKANG